MMGLTADQYNTRYARYEVRAREAFKQLRGAHDESGRLRDIDALPIIIYKGRYLVQLICIACGNFRNVPRGQAWALIDINHFICPWCAVRG